MLSLRYRVVKEHELVTKIHDGTAVGSGIACAPKEEIVGDFQQRALQNHPSARAPRKGTHVNPEKSDNIK